ncbi:hypothetical protein [Priestia aryabhattai]|uniref:hypothetical protein n=1 Tax=Priestia aryabhattai TaxID=412384 RepID=UPI003C8592BA
MVVNKIVEGEEYLLIKREHPIMKRIPIFDECVMFFAYSTKKDRDYIRAVPNLPRFKSPIVFEKHPEKLDHFYIRMVRSNKEGYNYFAVDPEDDGVYLSDKSDAVTFKFELSTLGRINIWPSDKDSVHSCFKLVDIGNLSTKKLFVPETYSFRVENV